VATPALLLVCEPPVMVPPPDATANVTATPANAAPELLVTFTDGAIATVVPTVAD
jgi:hypothetical protein